MRFGILSLLGLLSLLCQAQRLPAALVMSATGVYDEQAVRLNTIETTATPTVNSGSTVSYTTLNDFKTLMSTAFANGTGGVINFDSFTGTQPSNQMVVSYGGLTPLTINSAGAANTFQIDMSANDAIRATPISGGTYLRSTAATHVYNFVTPLNDLGFTILGRNVTRSVAVTLGYHDGTNVLLNNVTIAASGSPDSAFSNTSLGDTFFGFTAPAGKAITSLTLTPNPGDAFFVLDDMGFVVSSIPEPSTVTLGAVLFAGGCWFMQRRTRRST